jgi:hypothetical protein
MYMNKAFSGFLQDLTYDDRLQQICSTVITASSLIQHLGQQFTQLT